MNVKDFLSEIRQSSGYRDQIVYVREEAGRSAIYATASKPVSAPVADMLEKRGIGKLYVHQAQAIDVFRAGQDPLAVTGTASGKSLCYLIPILEILLGIPGPGSSFCFPPRHCARTSSRDSSAR